MYQETSREVLDFIKHSPSCFHAVHQLSRMLDQAGYQRLMECERWALEKGGKYYVTRNGSSIIAFHVGQQLDNYHFQITASHSDSPSNKVTEKAELKGKGGYTGGEKNVVLCAFKRSQIAAIKASVMAVDPKAFIIVCEAHEILGEGFGAYSPDSL